MRVAAINWELRPGATIQRFVDEVSSACDQGAELVVLPELAILDLLEPDGARPPMETARVLAERAPEYLSALCEVAQSRGATIVAGSIFLPFESQIQNVCPILLSDGRCIQTAKNRLTAYERDEWRLAPGSSLALVKSLSLGVAICYDSEFPEAVRALAEAGARLVCVPAFTETRQGFQRVRWCAQARAVENQVFVVHASLVGGHGIEPVPSAYGSSAILCPSHFPFPESAVLAESELNRHGIASADLDFAAIEACRAAGDVRNWADREPKSWQVEVL